jgi:hypothetical protein
MIDVSVLTDLASYLATHTAVHGLSAPVSANVGTTTYGSEIMVHVVDLDLPTLAAGLVSWVESFDQTTSLRAWRSLSGTVHIDAVGTVKLPTGPVTLTVWGCSDHPALAIVGEQNCPVSIQDLKSWVSIDLVRS